MKSYSICTENLFCRLFKKISEARRAWTVIVKRDREIHTSTNTSHKHEFVRDD